MTQLWDFKTADLSHRRFQDPTFYYHWLDHKSCLHCGSQNIKRPTHPGVLKRWPWECDDCGRKFEPMAPPEFQNGERVVYRGYPSERGELGKYPHLPTEQGMIGTIEDRSQNPDAGGAWLYHVRFKGISDKPQPSFGDLLGEEQAKAVGLGKEPRTPDSEGKYDHVNWFGGNTLERAVDIDDTFPESWNFQSSAEQWQPGTSGLGLWWPATDRVLVWSDDRNPEDVERADENAAGGQAVRFSIRPNGTVQPDSANVPLEDLQSAVEAIDPSLKVDHSPWSIKGLDGPTEPLPEWPDLSDHGWLGDGTQRQNPQIRDDYQGAGT